MRGGRPAAGQALPRPERWRPPTADLDVDRDALRVHLGFACRDAGCPASAPSRSASGCSPARDERPAISGHCHFLEHLLFKGTDHRTALDIAEAFDAVGGDVNAFTAKEYTCYFARVLDRDLEMAVDHLADMLHTRRSRRPTSRPSPT
jgi:hypothetical protein